MVGPVLEDLLDQDVPNLKPRGPLVKKEICHQQILCHCPVGEFMETHIWIRCDRVQKKSIVNQGVVQVTIQVHKNITSVNCPTSTGPLVQHK